MTAAAAWPVCTICYEDLRPLSDQHLHCLPACGYVFHALCLEQWLEYCPGGKKKRTCPVCKQACGAAHPPTRLYFQSTGTCPTQAGPASSQDSPGGPDREALADEVARLEQKAASLGRVVEEQRDGIKNLNTEVARWMAKAAYAEAMQEAARKDKECAQMLLTAKTEELSRKTSECGRLQEKSLALAKELAAVKLSSDMNLQEDEILKLASLGVLLGRKNDNLTEAGLGSGLKEGASSPDHCFSQGDHARDGENSFENGSCTPRHCDSNCSHEQPFFNFDDSHSYIHPFIKQRISHHWDIAFNQNKEALSHHVEEPSCPHEKIPVDSSEHEDAADTAASDEVLKTSSLEILDHAPDDEVEGEIVYLQARLLDNAVVLKHRYDKLIAKVVQNISRELDAFSRRKWDLIFVNQFLRDVREAKKRGRKEKRHKEAQAVLAAAAAAVASSSRNSTLRKDAKEDVAPANQESSPKLVAGSSRVGQRTKDSSKSSNSKLPPDNKFGGFHMPVSANENALYCDVCMRTETLLNRIFICSRCKAAVHIDCYRNLENSIGPWKCELCEDQDISLETPTTSDKLDCNGKKSPFARCGMCHGTSGAFRKTADGQWVHAFCAEWLLDTKYVRGQENPVEGMESLVEGKDTCCLCLRKVGMCLRCSSGDCHITFHPTCARNSGFYMNTKGFGTTLEHKAYCGKHSAQQKEEDAQRYGPEDLRSMKRMRVELEKLRLLCERVIKREKVKRETVLCDHDILAKTKDTVIFSYLACGASSESATTSVNNRSYSGAAQRSDDVTVDSTLSRKKTIRFSLNSRDAERNTADSSRTLISFKRKLSERGLHAGKQLPQRSAITSHKLDGENKTNDKKIEMFQKELVMTSDQASTQNQRLPKGYVYVPRDSLSKERPWNRNTQPHTPQEPGG